MDELIQAMSIPDLVQFKEQYKDNESIQKIVDGYIQVKEQEQAKVKAEADFGKAIAKMVDKLPHPDNVHNVYLRWAEVEVPEGEPQIVRIGGEVTKEELAEIASFKDNPEMTDDGIKAYFEAKGLKLTQPIRKVLQWVVELNKGFQVVKSASTATTSKRALTIKKIEGDSLVPVGNYRNASEACKHLNLPIGGDSATRVLQREGYLTQVYEGTDFAVATS